MTEKELPILEVQDLLAQLGIDHAPHQGTADLTSTSHQPKPVNQSNVKPNESGAITTGNRNNALTSIAGLMRRQGSDPERIGTALAAINSILLDEPLPEEEVASVAQGIARYPTGGGSVADLNLHDAGNATRLVSNFGNKIRYVTDWGKWIIWNGRYWEIDARKQIVELAKKTATMIYREAASVSGKDLTKAIVKHAKNSHAVARIDAMVKLASSIESVVVASTDLDLDGWKLCVENGVIDLRSGTLYPHDPKDLMTRLAPVTFDSSARCRRWKRFLIRVFAGNRSLIRYIRRLMGYALTGETVEQAVFFLYGSGANGKSTFLNVLRELLGTGYAKQTPYDALTAKPHGRSASNELARLQGVRVTATSEVEDGTRLAESLIKQLTGGEAMSARFLFSEYFDFMPLFKLFIAGNHKPQIHGDDDGIWRRLHLIPFSVRISEAERDPHLLDKLREELSGILSWAIRGCLEWQKIGLQPPDIVRNAVEEYREDSDILGEWITECCRLGVAESVQANAAYQSYQHWALRSSLKPMSRIAFCRKLAERFKKHKTAQATVYWGLNVVA